MPLMGCRGRWVSWAVSLWHKRAGVATLWSSLIRAPNLISTLKNWNFQKSEVSEPAAGHHYRVKAGRESRSVIAFLSNWVFRIDFLVLRSFLYMLNYIVKLFIYHSIYPMFGTRYFFTVIWYLILKNRYFLNFLKWKWNKLLITIECFSSKVFLKTTFLKRLCLPRTLLNVDFGWISDLESESNQYIKTLMKSTVNAYKLHT